MFSTAVALALLPTVAVAASGFEDVPVVEAASAELQGDRLAAEITTTLPVFQEDLRVKIDGRNLVVYVNGAAIQGGKRSFGEGPTAIHALPRASYAKLEVPMPAGKTCALPATVTVEEGLIHVSVNCAVTGSGAAAAAPAAAPTATAVAVAAKKAAAVPSEWAAPPKATAHEAAAVDPTPAPLRGLLAERNAAAPKERSVAASGASVVAPEAAVAHEVAAAPKAEAKTEIKAEAKAESVKVEPAKVEPAAPVAAAPVVDKVTTAADKSAPQAEAKGASPMLVGAGLVLATMVAFVLWRRRRVNHAGLIRILETASLGPKRTLVVAEIDGEKMILGTSEAGISVLTPTSRMPSPWGENTGATQMNLPPGFAEISKISNIANLAAAAAHHAASTASAVAMAAPVTMAAHAVHAANSAHAAHSDHAANAPEDNEGGLLSRLFRRNPAPVHNDEKDDIESLGNMADEFQDLLADSIEDEELRRRLQAGIGGRTS